MTQDYPLTIVDNIGVAADHKNCQLRSTKTLEHSTIIRASVSTSYHCIF